MRTKLLLPLALAGLLGGCAVYGPDPYYAPDYAYRYRYYDGVPRYYGPPAAIIVQPPPVHVVPRPPGGRRYFDRDRDRDGVPDRFDRHPRGGPGRR